MHGRLAHVEAARSVLNRGRTLVTHLAGQPVVRGEAGRPEDWQHFSRQVGSIHAVENGLQYVSVLKDGVTVFHEQTTALEETGAAAEVSPPAENRGMDVRMTRKLLRVGDRTVPVVVFAARFLGDDGKLGLVEIALRKERVDLEESSAADAITAMFRVSLATVIVSFGICVLLVVWMMRRESRREQQRRDEEHLAFAGVLANGIVHDFRNPMSSMRLDVQMLNKEVARGESCRAGRVAELAARIQNTIDRLDKVFKEFLYVSKPPSDERESLDLADCINECIAMLEPRLAQAEVRVKLDLPYDGLQVLAYQASLQRALMNVITNAEQFSRPGEAVTVKAHRAGRHARIDVIDSGPGVPGSDRHRVFDMFVSSRPGGTGLGLFLARTAIERCGGSIEIVDTREEGACFRIVLPLANSNTEEAHE
jgi:signal transduction histidine kinase